MTPLPQTLSDGDLRLRPPDTGDLPVLVAHLNDDRVACWLAAVARPFGDMEAKELLRHGDAEGEAFRLIELDGEVAGGLCLGASLWYWLTPDRWGHGVMFRALTLALAARFARPAPPVHATCHEENHASQRLLTRLGFAPHPRPRRLFFQGSGRAEPCRDHVLAPEQWHLLHPPRIAAGTAWLRPALQKDVPTLLPILPGPPAAPWPAPDALPGFIECHRFRGADRGLFVVEDDCRRSVGLALVDADGLHLRFLSGSETRHRDAVRKAVTDRFSPPPRP